MDERLVYAVTALGGLLSLFSFLVIFLGKRVPGDAGSPQELEFKGLKAKTNVMVMLLIISALVAVLPLWLLADLEGKRIEALHKQAPAAGPGAASGVAEAASAPGYQIFFNGEVLNDRGKPSVGAEVSLVNMSRIPSGGAPSAVHTVKTDSSGAFDMPPVTVTPSDRYLLVATGAGHKNELLKIRPLSIGPGNGIYVKLFMMKSGEETDQ